MPFLPTLLHHCSTHEHQLLFLHIPLPSTTAPIFNTTASQLVTTPSAGQGGTLPSSHTASESLLFTVPSPTPSSPCVVPANFPPSTPFHTLLDPTHLFVECHHVWAYFTLERGS